MTTFPAEIDYETVLQSVLSYLGTYITVTSDVVELCREFDLRPIIRDGDKFCWSLCDFCDLIDRGAVLARSLSEKARQKYFTGGSLPRVLHLEGRDFLSAESVRETQLRLFDD